MALTQISTDGVKSDAITAGKIPANAVGSSEIADDAVGSAQIADDGVVQAAIADDAVGADQIADDAVVQAAISDDAVDEARLQISNAGSNGQYLQKQSGNTGGLTWAAVASYSISSDLLDEDDMATNSATKVASQQSVKAYVDNQDALQATLTGASFTGNVSTTGTLTDSKGNVRSIISNAKSSAHTLVAADAGKAIYTSSGGVTVPNSVMSASDAVTIINNSGSDQTITQGSGVTLHNSADASTGNRTLAARGMATIWFASASVAYISGAGLS